MTGTTLQQTINERGLTVRELAYRTGYTEARIYQLLRLGNKELPERTAIVLQHKLASALEEG